MTTPPPKQTSEIFVNVWFDAKNIDELNETRESIRKVVDEHRKQFILNDESKEDSFLGYEDSSGTELPALRNDSENMMRRDMQFRCESDDAAIKLLDKITSECPMVKGDVFKT